MCMWRVSCWEKYSYSAFRAVFKMLVSKGQQHFRHSNILDKNCVASISKLGLILIKIKYETKQQDSSGELQTNTMS